MALERASRNIRKRKIQAPVGFAKAILSQVRADAQLVFPTNDLPTDSRDPDDNNVLQVALFMKANFIITGDHDLLDLKEIEGVTIINPSTFYERYIS